MRCEEKVCEIGTKIGGGWTDIGSCLMADLHISSVETSDSATGGLVGWLVCWFIGYFVS
jgi:hypothetical protein